MSPKDISRQGEPTRLSRYCAYLLAAFVGFSIHWERAGCPSPLQLAKTLLPFKKRLQHLEREMPLVIEDSTPEYYCYGCDLPYDTVDELMDHVKEAHMRSRYQDGEV